MEGTNATATLSLAIDTTKAKSELASLALEYGRVSKLLEGGLGTDIGKGIAESVKGLQASLNAVSGGIVSVNHALDDIVAIGGKSFNPLSNGAKAAAAAIAALTAATSANAAAAQSGNNATAAKLLKERAEAATLATEAEKRLVQVTSANVAIAHAGNNASTVKLLKERAEAATLAAEAEKRLAQVTAANISAAQSGNSAATVRLLKERADAATLAAEAEKRLAQVTAANALAAQAGNNAATVKLLRERAEAATLAAEAERRLAQVSAANVAAAQAAHNATTVRLLKERADAALLAAAAEDRLAKATRDNTAAAMAAYLQNTQKLTQQRSDLLAGKSVTSYNSLTNTVERTGPTVVPLAAPSAQPVEQLDSAHKSLAKSAGDSSKSQSHWNKLANEGHAAARGLAGAVGGLWLTYGSLAPLLAGAAIAGGFKAATKAGSEFAYQLTFVKALGGESAEAISSISKATLAMASNSLHAPVEMANGLRVLAQAGLGAADALYALPTALDLATVGELSMENAAITLTGVMNAFSLQVTDMGHIGDVFAKAAAVSQTSVVAMTQSMRTASVVGEQYGASLEDTAAALTVLAKINITGTAAGTSLRNMLKELYAPTQGAAKVMKQLGLETADALGNVKSFPDIIYDLQGRLSQFDKASQVNILQKLFGERGAKEAIALLGQTREEWEKLKGSLANSDGFITSVAAELEQTTKGRFQQALNTMQGNMIKAFDSSEGSVRNLADSLKDLASSEEFTRSINTIVGSVAKFADILVKTTPYLINFGEAFIAFKAFGFLTSGILAASTALAGLGTSLKIVGGALATGGVGLASLRAGLLATSSAAATAAGATGLAGLVPLAARLFSPAGLIAIGITAVGALAYQLNKMTDGTDDATRAAGNFAGALGREADKLQDSINLLRERNRLQAQGFSGDDASTNIVQKTHDRLGQQVENQRKIISIIKGSSTGTLSDIADIAQANDKLQQLSESYKKSSEALPKVKALQQEQRVEEVVGLANQMRVAAEKAERDALKSGRPVDTVFGQQVASLQALAKDLVAGGEVGEKARGQLDSEAVRGLKSAYGEFLDDSRSDGLKVGTEKFVPTKTEKKTGGANRGELKDFRAIQNDNLSSALKREQIELSKQLGSVEVELAAQTISAAVAQERKNAASLTELEVEGRIIAQYLAAAKATGDKLQITKFENDLKENGLKIDEKRQQAALNLIQVHTADTNAVEDMGLASKRYVEDLEFEIKMLGKTAIEVANLRIERERSRALENLGVQVARHQVNEPVAAAMREDIAARAEAQKADAAYQESYVGGWAKARDAWVKNATSAAKQAADSFQAMSSAMETALDTFLTTGKLDFAAFAKSIILDIAKIEAKALIAKNLPQGGSGGGGGFGGILGAIMGMFGGGGGGGGATNFLSPLSVAGVALRSANGNVFSGSPSLHQYANTVQTTPQSFAYQNLHGFAKGGVFAEAGPEAVMPLTRDHQGRLGVKAQNDSSGPVSIVVHVNGNSNAPDVRRAAGQGAREALNAFNGARRYA